MPFKVATNRDLRIGTMASLPSAPRASTVLKANPDIEWEWSPRTWSR